MIEAVLLDWGGTLCHYLGAARLFEDAASRLGRVMRPGDADRLVERLVEVSTRPDVIEAERGRDLSVETSRRANLVSLRAIGLDDEFAEAICDREDEADAYWPYPDTARFLGTLKNADLRVAVVSNCGIDIRANFDYHDLTGYVDEFVLSCEHGVRKPERRIFEIALDALEVRAADALMVGDALPDAGALAAGIRTILLPPSGPSRQRRERDLGHDNQPDRGLDFVLTALGLSTSTVIQ